MIKPPDFCQTCRWLEGEACGLHKLHEISWGKTNFGCDDWAPHTCADCQHFERAALYCGWYGEDVDDTYTCDTWEG